MDEKYENIESLWGERHLTAFTRARCLLPMHHSRFWEVFSISSHGAVSNFQTCEENALGPSVQEPAQQEAHLQRL